jgi:TnpA family transposase
MANAGRSEARSKRGQEEQLGSLGLALNVVVHWNAIYTQEAVRHVRQGAWMSTTTTSSTCPR